ncbi:MAG: hypothetical protein ACJAZ3_001595 [Sphingobacteriales bacterium]|jgi:hypothetical protein
MRNPKYRNLSIEELQTLEKEFIEFLVVNGLTGMDWEKLKKEQPEEAEAIVIQFSDVVFEGIMRKVKFLEYVSEKHIYCFQCLDDQLVLVCAEASDVEHANFRDPEFYKKALLGKENKVYVFTEIKKYNLVRELELFDMIQKGCQITEGELFKQLSMALEN